MIVDPAASPRAGGYVEVTILGTSQPAQSLRNGYAGSGLLVSHRSTHVLLDCGPGVARQLDVAGRALTDVSHVFLTHHHWDHISDLGAFVLGRWEQGLFASARGGDREIAPLQVLGPRRTERVCDLLLGDDGVYAEDIATRRAGDIGGTLYRARGVTAPLHAPIYVARDLAPGASLSVDDLTITTSLANHCQPYLDSIALRVEAAGATIVYSGDSAPSDDLLELATGADVLIHEAGMSPSTRELLGPRRIHSTPEEVGETAARAGVTRLVLVHHHLERDDASARMRYQEMAGRAFSGPVHLACSGDVIHAG